MLWSCSRPPAVCAEMAHLNLHLMTPVSIIINSRQHRYAALDLSYPSSTIQIFQLSLRGLPSPTALPYLHYPARQPLFTNLLNAAYSGT